MKKSAKPEEFTEEKDKMLSKKREGDSINTTDQAKRKFNANNTPSSLPKEDISEFLYKSNLKLSDIGGFDELISEIKETIGNPLNYYNIYKHLNVEPVKGILLCGPPGCGKTTIANAIGGEWDVPFYKITAPQIVSSLSGESEMKIRQLFAEVVQSAPSILFIDEIESILGKRENASKDMERRIVAQIMSCIDEISYKDMKLEAPVFIIGATSKPEFIDSSVRRSGRFDKEIHIGFPTQDMREKMLRSIAKDKRIAADVEFSNLAKMTPGYLAADLQSLIREAGKLAIRRIVNEIENKQSNTNTNEDKNEENKLIIVESNNTNVNNIPSENINTTSENVPTENINTISNNETSENDFINTNSEMINLPNPEIQLEQDKTNSNSIDNTFNLQHHSIELNDFTEAIKTIQPTSKREGFTTIPNVCWGDIGGLEKLREELYFDIVMPILEPQKLKKVGIDRAVGVLLYGPPGCGKTLLAKAVANEAQSNFISVKGPELLNKYVGESEKAVRQLFIRARNSSPCIIFFDELDALCPKRSMDNNAATERVVNQLLTEMDGLEERKQVFIIAATNRPDIIDPAMLRPGRLDKLLYVPLPDSSDRLSIIKTVSKKLPLSEDINLEEICKSERLEGFSGADVSMLVREAQMRCLRRCQKDDGEFVITLEDMSNAMDNVRPSVSRGDKEKYENLKKFLHESRSHMK